MGWGSGGLPPWLELVPRSKLGTSSEVRSVGVKSPYIKGATQPDEKPGNKPGLSRGYKSKVILQETNLKARCLMNPEMKGSEEFAYPVMRRLGPRADG